MDSDGSVLVGGYHADNLAPHTMWMVREYAPDGRVLWSVTYSGYPGGIVDSIRGVAVDSRGNHFAAGSVSPLAFRSMWWIQKYDSGGNLVWTRSYDGDPNATDQALSCIVTSSNELLVAGYANTPWTNLMRKYDLDGNLVWSRTVAGLFYRIAAAPGGGIVGLAGNVVCLLDASASLIWSRTQPSSFLVGGVAVDGLGNVYTGGTAGVAGSRDWIVTKYDGAGKVLWSRTYDSPAHADDRLYDVALSALGDLVAVGDEARSDLGQNNDVRVNAYTVGGDYLWTWTYNGSANSADFGTAVGFDRQGNMYAGAVSAKASGEYDWLVMKYTGPPLLNAALTSPASLLIGASSPVVLSLANTGATTAYDVRPSLAFSGAGVLRITGGPSPASLAALAPGDPKAVTWEVTARSPGMVDLTATGSHTRACDGLLRAASVQASLSVGGFRPGICETPTAYPNPFNRARASGGTLKFCGVKPGTVVRITDVTGLVVWRGTADPSGQVQWDGRNRSGKLVAFGVYVWLAEGASGAERGKLIVE